jgi:hypothetical protein
MSIAVMSRVWANSQSKGGDLLVLLAIADFAHDNGVAFPSVPTLAKKSRLTARQVSTILKRLQDRGELSVQTNKGPHGTNLYRVLVGDEALSGGDEVRNKLPMKSASYEPSEESSETSAGRGSKVKKAQYDALWEAFIAAGVARPTTKNEKGKLNAAVRQLLEAEADPAQIAPRAERYKRTYPGVPFTAMGLVGHWSESGQRRERLASVRDCPECSLSFPPVKLKEHRYSVHGIGDICPECGGVCQDDVQDSCPCGKLVSAG